MRRQSEVERWNGATARCCLTPKKTYANISNMDSPVGIYEAAKAIGVSVDSLRRWERKGKITSQRTIGGHRRYSVSRLRDEIAAIRGKT